VVFVSLAIRVYNLGTFPDTLLADEADNAQDAVRNLYGLGPVNGFFGLDWTAQPAFSSYLMSAFLFVLGPTGEAIRLPSALISALALIPFYLLLRRQFSVIATLLTTLLLATNVWYLNFSRSGWNNVHVCFYMLMAMLFLTLALDTLTSKPSAHLQRWLLFGAAGAFCALGLYSYPSGRAIILGILAFFPIALWFYRRWKMSLLLGYVAMGATAAVLFAPQALYIARNWELFNGRSSVVALVNSPDYRADPAGTLWQQISRNVRGSWDGSVNNTAQYSPVGKPQLETFTGVLVIAGMALSLVLPRLRRRPETWLWWVILLVAWFATQVMTVGTPNGARGIGYVPLLLYFAAITLEMPIVLSQRLPRIARLPVAGAIAVAILLVSASNVSY
jgi:4-amino-4-deoxy-L-arabinose transferase-like glycosyltransferase